MGEVPYGFRLAADGAHLEADEAEQTVLAVLRDLCASGLSQRAIVSELAARGLVSRVSRPFDAGSSDAHQGGCMNARIRSALEDSTASWPAGLGCDSGGRKRG